MKLSRLLGPLCLSFGFIAATPAALAAGPFSSMYVFGDSLSDNGNGFALSGNTFPPPPYFNGRFSNGPVAAERMASTLGIPLVDFAVGGAKTGVGNIEPLLGATGLQSQVAGFGSQLQAAGHAADPTALYMVWAGPNDFDPVAQFTNDAVIAAADTAAANVAASLTSLYGFGARQFFVPSIPDLSLTPGLRGTPAEGAGLLYSNTFASELDQELDGLLSLAGIELRRFDTLALSRNVVAHPGDYGFTNATDACVYQLATCNPDQFVYWDLEHPTARSHEYLAAAFLTAVPEPGTYALMFAGLGVLGALARRRQA